MKKTFFLSLLLTIICSPVFAETIHLKNGKTVSGTIADRSDKSIKITVDGMNMTYFADEIADIDGAPMQTATAATPAVVTPAAAPVAAQEEPVVNEASAPAPVEPVTAGSKRDLILKFIDVFGTRAAMTQNLAAMVKSLPADNPQTAKIKEGIKVDEIIDRLIPIYDKQFSADDLKAFIAFYSSAAGQKLVQGIPEIMRESIDVSGQYFQEKFPEMKEEDKK